MAKQYATTVRRIGCGLAAAILLGSVGCGWSSGRYASDPMLGNFNRPIAATPPIFTGGDPGTSPAYDGGVRLGLPSPDVANPQVTSDRSFIMPTFQGGLGLGGMFKGGSNSVTPPIPTSGSGASFTRPSPAAPSNIGARLPSLDTDSDKNTMFVAGMVSPIPGSSVASARPRDVNALFTNGSSIDPTLPTVKVTPQEKLRNPDRIKSVEEAQSLLSTCGAKTQALEQAPTGEWRYVCTMGDGSDHRRYEAKHREPIEAVRAVLLQVQSEK